MGRIEFVSSGNFSKSMMFRTVGADICLTSQTCFAFINVYILMNSFISIKMCYEIQIDYHSSLSYLHFECSMGCFMNINKFYFAKIPKDRIRFFFQNTKIDFGNKLRFTMEHLFAICKRLDVPIEWER